MYKFTRRIYEAAGSGNLGSSAAAYPPASPTSPVPPGDGVINLGDRAIAEHQAGYQHSMKQFFDAKLAAQKSAPESRNKSFVRRRRVFYTI